MNRVVCNCCGKEFDAYDVREGLSVHRLSGHGSKHEGASIDLDLCAECTDRVYDSLVEACAYAFITDGKVIVGEDEFNSVETESVVAEENQSVPADAEVYDMMADFAEQDAGYAESAAADYDCAQYAEVE